MPCCSSHQTMLERPDMWPIRITCFRPEIAGRNAGINTICEPIVALSHGLDDGGCVNAGAGLKGVLSKDRVVSWQRDFDVFVGLLHVGVKQREIVVDDAHQLEIDQRLVERCIACTFTHAEGCTVNDVRTCFHSSDVVGNSEATVLMAVPVDLDFSSLISCVLDDLLLNESEEFFHAVGVMCPHVSQTHSLRTPSSMAR